MRECVYLLQHTYSYGEQSEYEENKIIGIYSSRDNAEKELKKYLKLPGFNEYDSSCFSIDEYIVDKGEWNEGFVKAQ